MVAIFRQSLFFICVSLFSLSAHSLVELNDQTFDETISSNDESDMWIIDFYAVSIDCKGCNFQ